MENGPKRDGIEVSKIARKPLLTPGLEHADLLESWRAEQEGDDEGIDFRELVKSAVDQDQRETIFLRVAQRCLTPNWRRDPAIAAFVKRAFVADDDPQIAAKYIAADFFAGGGDVPEEVMSYARALLTARVHEQVIAQERARDRAERLLEGFSDDVLALRVSHDLPVGEDDLRRRLEKLSVRFMRVGDDHHMRDTGEYSPFHHLAQLDASLLDETWRTEMKAGHEFFHGIAGVVFPRDVEGREDRDRDPIKEGLAVHNQYAWLNEAYTQSLEIMRVDERLVKDEARAHGSADALCAYARAHYADERNLVHLLLEESAERGGGNLTDRDFLAAWFEDDAGAELTDGFIAWRALEKKIDGLFYEGFFNRLDRIIMDDQPHLEDDKEAYIEHRKRALQNAAWYITSGSWRADAPSSR